MTISVSGSLSLASNCSVDGLTLVPGVGWSCRLTLSISGVSSVTSVAYTGSNPAFTVTGGGSIWTIDDVFGQSVFPNESLEFVQYDENFDPTYYEVDTADDQPPNSSVFEYHPPEPFSRPTAITFLIHYVSEGTAAGPGGVPPAVPGTPSSASASVTVIFEWDPDIGLGQLQTAIDQSVY